MKIFRTHSLYYTLLDAYKLEAFRRVTEGLPPQDEWVLVLHRVMKQLGATFSDNYWTFEGEAGTAFALQYPHLLEDSRAFIGSGEQLLEYFELDNHSVSV